MYINKKDTNTTKIDLKDWDVANFKMCKMAEELKTKMFSIPPSLRLLFYCVMNDT